MNTESIILIALGIFTFISVLAFIAFLLRVVVDPNEVHIVQSRKETTSYGKDTGHGNVYYNWPHWLPILGISRTVLPVSVFDINLGDYEAYDIGRVPFVVDIVAFFRVDKTNVAAQRVANFQELKDQLRSIVQGAIRTVLAKHDIDAIMEDRSTFGKLFTEEVNPQLESWGVTSVKNIELMDIRDAAGGENNVVRDIMEKKKSQIEKESRVIVAQNKRDASIAEINASRETQITNEAAVQAVGERHAENTKMVGIANEKALQDINDQKTVTMDKQMNIIKVEKVRAAEINKEQEVVKAEEHKATMMIMADGDLYDKQKEAEEIKAVGDAKAAAETAWLQAPVTTQINLAKEIGENEGYQQYLITIRDIEAKQVIGTAQAEALKDADLKVIANSGNVPDGVNRLSNLLTPKVGTNISGMVEAFSQTPKGKELIDKFLGKNPGQESE